MNDNLVTNYTQLGIEKGLIAFSDDGKRIEYIEQNKSRNFDNPEEKVQAEAYCRLILEYGYPKQRVKLFVTVPMGVERKEADLSTAYFGGMQKRRNFRSGVQASD
jgi:type I restriction enzyme M protein